MKRFDRIPTTPWLKLATKRGSGPKEGAPIPRIEVAVAPTQPTRVADYRRICGIPDDGKLPLCFPQVMAVGLHMQVLCDSRLPIPALGIVHVSQYIRQEGSIPDDAPLGLRCWLEGHRQARRGGELDLHTVATLDGREVWQGRTVFLSRAIRGHGEKAERAPDPSPERVERSLAWRLPEDLGRRYADIAGDKNPIHQYAWSARLFGFDRAIMHGMWLMARAIAEVDRPLEQVETHFRRPVKLPGAATLVSGPLEEGVAFQLTSTRSSGAQTVHLVGRGR